MRLRRWAVVGAYWERGTDESHGERHELDALLAAGWEPFAETDHVVVLRKRVWRWRVALVRQVA